MVFISAKNPHFSEGGYFNTSDVLRLEFGVFAAPKAPRGIFGFLTPQIWGLARNERGAEGAAEIVWVVDPPPPNWKFSSKVNAAPKAPRGILDFRWPEGA